MASAGICSAIVYDAEVEQAVTDDARRMGPKGLTIEYCKQGIRTHAAARS